MRFDPLHVSPWVAGVVAGLGFGVVFGVLVWIADPGLWPETLIAGLVGGVLMSLAVGLSAWRMQRRFAPDIAGLSQESAQVAYRVAQHGEVATDPEIRAAALRIAERQLATAVRYRILAMIAAGCLVLAAVVAVLDGESWWRAWPTVVPVAVIGIQINQPRRLRRRIELLRSPATAD